MKKIRFGVIFLFSVFRGLSFAESNLPSLLFGYLKNDLSLQKSALTAENKALSYDSTKIQNGIELTLSSGTVKIQSSSDGTKYTFSPSASLSVPELNGTKLTATFPVTQKSAYSNDDENGTFLDNGTIKLSTGIITKAPFLR